MGWSRVQGSDGIIGDEPLELLEDALEAVAASYLQAPERRPTKKEWEHLLHAVFAAFEDEVVSEPVRKVVSD